MQQVSLADFHGTSVSIIDHAGKKWLTAEQAGLCLGYNEANASQGIRNLYNRHLDRFDDGDTCQLNLSWQGQMREMRLFSDTGCVVLGWLANTKGAIAFQRWAKKVLAAHMAGQAAVPPRLTSTLARRPLVATRRLERQVFELFVAGMGQAAIGQQLRCSATVVNQMLHAKYRFSPDAGESEVTPELIASVAARHLEIQTARLMIERERLAQKFLTDAHDQQLAEALNAVGKKLWQLALPAPTGDA